MRYSRNPGVIAVTLGIVLSVPVLIPVLYGSSTVTLSAGDRPGHLSERKDT
jgi:low temperature requirement protein LtrA